jgi:hypothetical protein
MQAESIIRELEKDVVQQFITASRLQALKMAVGKA